MGNNDYNAIRNRLSADDDGGPIDLNVRPGGFYYDDPTIEGPTRMGEQLGNFYDELDPALVQKGWGAEAMQMGPGAPATLAPPAPQMPPIPPEDAANQAQRDAGAGDLLSTILSTIGLGKR